MTNDNDNFFAEESKDDLSSTNQDYDIIKILVVDDEKDIHLVTEMVLEDFHFEGKSIEIINAYSGKEAREILLKEKNISLILLDVIMETETAGLDLVKYIREDLKSNNIRIILRTGQPGKVPLLHLIELMKYFFLLGEFP